MLDVQFSPNLKNIKLHTFLNRIILITLGTVGHEVLQLPSEHRHGGDSSVVGKKKKNGLHL